MTDLHSRASKRADSHGRFGRSFLPSHTAVPLDHSSQWTRSPFAVSRLAVALAQSHHFAAESCQNGMSYPDHGQITWTHARGRLSHVSLMVTRCSSRETSHIHYPANTTAPHKKALPTLQEQHSAPQGCRRWRATGWACGREAITVDTRLLCVAREV